MDVSTAELRVLRAVAERGTFTAAAAALGFTQSAVSRQVAGLERASGARLFERQRTGVRPTAAGLTLLRHARVVLDELAAADRELAGDTRPPRTVRLGLYVSAGAALLPDLLDRLDRLGADEPGPRLETREGTSPSLVRALRAGTLDLAVITSRPPFRPPDDELPRLHLETVGEAPLLVAASATGRFAGRSAVGADELAGVDWVASPGSGAEPLLGVWPGLPGRPHVAHNARDWLTKLRLVASGHGVTTVPATLVPVLPDGVLALAVEGVPPELRRMSVARLPGRPSTEIATVTRAVHGVG